MTHFASLVTLLITLSLTAYSLWADNKQEAGKSPSSDLRPEHPGVSPCVRR